MGYERLDWRVGSVVAKSINSYGGDKVPLYEAMLNRETMGLSDDAAVGFLSSMDTRNRNKTSDVEWIEKIAASVSDPELVQDVLDRIRKHLNE